MTPRFLLSAALVAACAAPAWADDDDFGAWLFRGSCEAFASGQVIEDLGDLDIEDDGHEDWRRVAPDAAPMPARLRIEDEDTDRVSAASIAEGGLAVAVTAADRPDSALLACAPLPAGMTLPAVLALAEIGGSGIEGRVAIEPHGRELRFTVAAFATGSVPALAR